MHKTKRITILAIIAFICSAIFFICYGPVLAISYWSILNKEGAMATSPVIYVQWVLTIIFGGWLLIVSLILNIIAIYQLKTKNPPAPTAYMVKWLCGSSLIGIITCLISFLLAFAQLGISNDFFLTTQAIVLFLLTIIPIIAQCKKPL